MSPKSKSTHLSAFGAFVSLLSFLPLAALGAAAEAAPKTPPASEAELPFRLNEKITLNLTLARSPEAESDEKNQDKTTGAPASFIAQQVKLKEIEFRHDETLDTETRVALRHEANPAEICGFEVAITLLDGAGKTVGVSEIPLPGPTLPRDGEPFQFQPWKLAIRPDAVKRIKSFRVALIELDLGGCSSDELQAFTASGGTAWREGRCVVIREGGGSPVRVCDDPAGGPDGVADLSHAYAGRLKAIGMHVIAVSAYEEGWHLLLHPDSGTVTRLDAMPRPSPDAKWLVTAIEDQMNGVARARIYRVTPTGATLAWEFAPEDFSEEKFRPLVEPKWISPTEIRFRIGGYNAEPSAKPPRTATLKLSDGKWKRAE